MKEFIEKLICKLEEKRNLYTDVLESMPNNQVVKGKVTGLCESIQIVNELAEEYKGGWIPCSERLPKEYNRYVWLSFTNQYCSYVQKAHWECGKFKWLNGRNIKDEPVAWKPYFAPEPYQPKGDQTE